MSVSQKIMGLIVKGPMTLGELAEALGKTETETKHSISSLISKRFVLRTRGLDETIEYKITPEGIEYHRRHLATLSPVERNDETPEHDAQPEAAAEEAASVVAEPGPDEDHAPIVEQEAVTADAGEPADAGAARIPFRFAEMFEKSDGSFTDLYVCDQTGIGEANAYRYEYQAVDKAIELSSISGVDVAVFRVSVIGEAKKTVQFFRAY